MPRLRLPWWLGVTVLVLIFTARLNHGVGSVYVMTGGGGLGEVMLVAALHACWIAARSYGCCPFHRCWKVWSA